MADPNLSPQQFGSAEFKAAGLAGHQRRIAEFHKRNDPPDTTSKVGTPELKAAVSAGHQRRISEFHKTMASRKS